jgi:Glycosyl hydrolases family 2, sugar binding domain/Beta-galactosidase second all-beta domain
MKSKHFKFLSFFVLALCLAVSTANAEDLRKIVSLSGTWKFSIGDDSKWAAPQFDDSGWDQITVPGAWENQGYNDYNGYAWYRKTFRIREIPANTTIFLMMGRIDDADEVYLNGKLVGKSGKFPPNFVTAYDRTRKYVISPELLKKDEDNVISVKVYDTYLDGGIIDGPTGIYTDEDNDLLNLNLSGDWKFKTGDNRNWRATDYNDEAWTKIYVPSIWENQGYEDYDGYAWYRLEFTAPQNLTAGDLYLSLGKIDDTDDVYLNGEYIGSVYDIRKKSYYRYSGWECNVRRVYKIKEGLLKRNGLNTIAVRVYDGQGLGGIYEGPIGIMSADNYHTYKNKYHNNDRSFWEYMYDMFFNHENSEEE